MKPCQKHIKNKKQFLHWIFIIFFFGIEYLIIEKEIVDIPIKTHNIIYKLCKN